MHGIDEGELEIGPLGYYASSLLYSHTRPITREEKPVEYRSTLLNKSLIATEIEKTQQARKIVPTKTD